MGMTGVSRRACRGHDGRVQESAITDAEFEALKVLVEEDDEDLFTYFEEYVERAGGRGAGRVMSWSYTAPPLLLPSAACRQAGR